MAAPERQLRIALLILVLAALLASGIAPYDRGVWWAEVAPVPPKSAWR